MRRARPRRWAAWLAVLLAGAGLVTAAGFVVDGSRGDQGRRTGKAREGGGRGSNPRLLGCDVDRRLLRRIWRGYRPYRSGDVLAIERRPHQFGTRHSGPYPYTQNVPLLLYGPGYIRGGVRVDDPVTVADLAPTFAHLMGFDAFPRRAGEVRTEALLPDTERNGIPKLLVTVVWDGGGDNVLAHWPETWPNLRALAERGVWYENATLGSSPSITPAVHATIGTGAFPKAHGLPDIKIRADGQILDAWEGGSPRFLEMPTLADLWDSANGNQPLVAALARDPWHLGMVGYGTMFAGGDRDVAVLDSFEGVRFRDDLRHFRLPAYLEGPIDLSAAVAELDRADGEADGAWLGNRLYPHDPHVRYTPVWPAYQTSVIVKLLRREGFGRDEISDLFYTNYKGIDLAGHEWNMLDEEVRALVRAHDAEIPRLIDALDDLVGPHSYLLALTADHGMAPPPEARGGWSISTDELRADIERAFNPDGEEYPLVMSHRGYQVMLDRERARKLGVAAKEVAMFMRNYTIRDNVTEESSEVFEKSFRTRADDPLFLTAMTPAQLQRAVRKCDAEGGR